MGAYWSRMAAGIKFPYEFVYSAEICGWKKGVPLFPTANHQAQASRLLGLRPTLGSFLRQ